MHTPGIWSLIIVGLLIVVLFGRPGKLSGFMEDLGKGIKGFRRGLGESDTPAPPPAPVEAPRQIPPAAEAAPVARDKSEA